MRDPRNDETWPMLTPPPRRPRSLWKLAVLVLALFAALVALSLLGGCGRTREAAKATAMADESLLAAQRLCEDLLPPPDATPEQLHAWVERLYGRIVAARRLLAPVKTRLAVGLQPGETASPANAETALADPKRFDELADRQVQAADQEAHDAGALTAFWVTVKGLLGVAASSGLGLALGGSAGGLGLAAMAIKGVQLYQHAKTVADEALTYGHDVSEKLEQFGGSQGKEALAKVRKEAVERQAKKGVWRTINRAVEAKKEQARQRAKVSKAA